MRRVEVIAVVVVFAVGLALGACGGGPCTAASCNGCCQADGQCVPGTSALACGAAGSTCSVCQTSQACMSGVCRGGAIDAGASGDVVVNELYGAGNNIGSDYVELFNAGSAAVDLSGFSVVDTDTADGGPKPREGVVFPSGTSLAAGAHLLVVADRRDAGATTACLGGVFSCFEARFGISQSNGETVFLLDARGQVVVSAYYPADGGPGPQSYGRLPDGTGSFRAMTATPGAANQP